MSAWCVAVVYAADGVRFLALEHCPAIERYFASVGGRWDEEWLHTEEVVPPDGSPQEPVTR